MVINSTRLNVHESTGEITVSCKYNYIQAKMTATEDEWDSRTDTRIYFRRSCFHLKYDVFVPSGFVFVIFTLCPLE